MVRMSSERDTVTSIRHQVDQYIRVKLEKAHTQADRAPTVVNGGGAQPTRLTPGSWESYRDVRGYEEEVMKAFGFMDFAEKLATFLQRYKFNVHGNDFSEPAGHQVHIGRMRVRQDVSNSLIAKRNP